MNKTFATLGIAGTLVFGASGVAVVDQRIDPYEDRTSHYELSITSDIPQGERVEIRKDKAELTLTGWSGEYAIKITPQIPSTRSDFNTPANRPLLSKRMEYKSGNVTAFIEPVSSNEFDIDFTLDSKPATNVFEYKIEGADNFDFWYQPALTQQEIDEGSSRPDNVTGSYAVYHKTKANHRVGSTNYATGKAFHIYRPKAIDANGEEVWAELSYTEGVLGVTVPQKFLDEAVYPVVVDPTFGYTTLGGTSAIGFAIDTNDGANRYGMVFTATEGGTLDSLHIGIDSETQTETVDFTAFMNLVDAGNSHSEIASVERLDLSITTTAAFYTFTAASESFSAGDYIISGSADGSDIAGSGDILVVYDSEVGHEKVEQFFSGAGGYAASKEDPWTQGETGVSIHLSLYATYTASGGGGSVPKQDIIWFNEE